MPLVEYAFICTDCYVSDYQGTDGIAYDPDVPKGTSCIRCGVLLPESDEKEALAQLALLRRQKKELQDELEFAERTIQQLAIKSCDPGDCGCAGLCNQDDDPFGTFS